MVAQRQWVVTNRRAIELFDVQIDALTLDETVDRARSIVRSAVPSQHVVVNAAKLVEVAKNQPLRDIIRSCAIVNADGMSVVWASRILRKPLPERVAGVDLFARIVEAAHRDGSSVYFLGATSEVVERVAAEFARRHPGLEISGYHNGFWEDDEEVIRAVRAAHPDYLFLGIPSPRKEFWLNKNLDALGVPFVMGVGGSFDVVAGKVGRAPRWVQEAGFEWAWRLAQEPRRMWKRYLFSNSAFIRMVLTEWWATR
jgi:N-acetylglucosaminyldiphosphoundecaprenol N-acetyl-beta-D-mannosaminyltransferase